MENQRSRTRGSALGPGLGRRRAGPAWALGSGGVRGRRPGALHAGRGRWRAPGASTWGTPSPAPCPPRGGGSWAARCRLTVSSPAGGCVSSEAPSQLIFLINYSRALWFQPVKEASAAASLDSARGGKPAPRQTPGRSLFSGALSHSSPSSLAGSSRSRCSPRSGV